MNQKSARLRIILSVATANGLSACTEGEGASPQPNATLSPENSAALCADRIDNDGDQRFDCDDQDCSETTPCQLAPEPVRDAGGGSDASTPPDAGGRADIDPRPDTEPTTPDEDCFLPGDEDGDGRADCDDRDCRTSAACVDPFEFDCTDGRDDDADGLVDCRDTDCDTDSACLPSTPEVCGDGLDNDRNGLADCDDIACLDDVACRAACFSDANCLSTETCFDGFCEFALPNTYVLYAGLAEFAERDESGETWDAFGGAPDPKVEFAVDGVLLDEGGICDDAFRCDFTPRQYPVYLDWGTTIEVFLSDDDVASDDIVAYCSVAITSETVRQGVFRCEDGAVAGVDVYLGR